MEFYANIGIIPSIWEASPVYTTLLNRSLMSFLMLGGGYMFCVADSQTGRNPLVMNKNTLLPPLCRHSYKQPPAMGLTIQHGRHQFHNTSAELMRCPPPPPPPHPPSQKQHHISGNQGCSQGRAYVRVTSGTILAF